ncbi:hypothetical protein FVE85_9146 [Porphyridium purpureum]|uniref:CRM domain-containing protein n=1 Tax=Porphyridium purpureum TaxID=35688 RepID=A0A5J4YQA7_PORPP|nr:hypothetical protein FVE85_9146 [Porphyridium purpureum]|eukprot:POR9182..scf222_8
MQQGAMGVLLFVGGSHVFGRHEGRVLRRCRVPVRMQNDEGSHGEGSGPVPSGTLSSKQMAYLRSVAGMWEQSGKMSRMRIVPERMKDAAVLQELRGRMAAHELVKVKFDVEKRKQAIALADELAAALGAHVAHVVGHSALFVLQKEQGSVLDLETCSGHQLPAPVRGKRKNKAKNAAKPTG